MSRKKIFKYRITPGAVQGTLLRSTRYPYVSEFLVDADAFTGKCKEVQHPDGSTQMYSEAQLTGYKVAEEPIMKRKFFVLPVRQVGTRRVILPGPTKEIVWVDSDRIYLQVQYVEYEEVFQCSQREDNKHE